MKYQTFLLGCISCILINTAAKAIQNTTGYLPILEDGKKWVYVNHNLTFPDEMEDVYTIKEVIGDTLLNEYKCKIIKNIRRGSCSGQISIFLSYMREEDGLLCQIIPMDDGLFCHPLIDITLDSDSKYDMFGDDCGTLVNCGTCDVTLADTIEIRGVVRKRITLSPKSEDSNGLYWVEGIGSNAENYMTFSMIIPTCGVIETKLVACSRYDEIIFENEDFYANTMTDITNIKDDILNAPFTVEGNRLTLAPEATEATVHSAAGQLVGHLLPGQTLTLPRGIYILRTANKITKVAL